MGGGGQGGRIEVEEVGAREDRERRVEGGGHGGEGGSG